MMEDRPRYKNGILVYTAKDIYDDVAAGMDPDCLFVGMEKLDTITAERDEWKRRCQNLVEAMRHHGYSAESLARIAEGRDNG